MPRRKTDAQFKKEVRDIVGDEYVFLDTYVNGKTKLKVKHNKCGYTYEVFPSNFLRGERCPRCVASIRGKARKKTDAQFKQEIYDLVGNEYTFLDPYVNNHTNLRVKHNKCGHVYEVRPHNFLGGQRCPRCVAITRGEARIKTNVQFKHEVYSLVGDDYTFLEPYVNAKTKLKVKHNKCDNIYEVTPANFLTGYRCPYCSAGAKKTNTQFKWEIHALVGGEYTLLDTYVNAYTKIRIKHNKCGNIYKVRPTNFLSHNTRCPYCNMPKTEKTIAKILDTFNIKYEIQKTFDDLRDSQPLSYDFYIPDQNILIEYQGRQHYEYVGYFGGKSRLEYQQQHDKMKADYANSHDYHLIAIPYTEDTFSKIKKYLLIHGLSK